MANRNVYIWHRERIADLDDLIVPLTESRALLVFFLGGTERKSRLYWNDEWMERRRDRVDDSIWLKWQDKILKAILIRCGNDDSVRAPSRFCKPIFMRLYCIMCIKESIPLQLGKVDFCRKRWKLVLNRTRYYFVD